MTSRDHAVPEIRHDPAEQRFTVDLPHGAGYLIYRPAGPRTVEFLSTVVPPADRGRGAGEAIVLRALLWARDTGQAVVPTCPFVSWVVERHPEYAVLIAS